MQTATDEKLSDRINTIAARLAGLDRSLSIFGDSADAAMSDALYLLSHVAGNLNSDLSEIADEVEKLEVSHG